MFNPSDHGRKATSKKKTSLRARHRRMSFECCETRSMLSAAPNQADSDLFILVSGKLGDLHFERPVAHISSFHGNYAFMNSPSEGGFLSATNAVVDFQTSGLVAFSSSSGESFSTISAGLSSSGITLNFEPAGTGFTSKFNDLTPLVTPTPIVISESYNESRQSDGPNTLAEAATQGGAIRMEPILKAPGDSHAGGPISVSPQKVEVGESQINRLTVPTLATIQSSPVSGEWARAVVFEMAGGEPLLARKSSVSTDVKLSTGPQSEESPKPHTLSRVEIQTSLDPESQEAAASQDADGAVAKDAAAQAGSRPYATAINAAVDAFMANWSSARTDLSIFEGPALRLTPAAKAKAQTESAGAKPAELKGDEQASARAESESGLHHAGMDAAPVLIALALERWLHRRTANDKPKAGTIGIGS